jgi:hypothetical protein
MRTTSIRRGRLVSLVLAATLSIAACGATKPPNSVGPGNGHPVHPSASAGFGNGHTPPPASSAPTAARDLASFFSAAQQDDTQLRAAAALVNSGISAVGMRFSQATVDTVKAADPQVVGAAIPAGLDPALLQPTLLVYSELRSRYMAMRRIYVGLIANSGDTVGEYRGIMNCLGNGAVAASRFPADLAALEKESDAAPAVTTAAPDSRAAAELALRIADIGEANGGCASCGGQLATSLAPISWGWHGAWSGLGAWGDGSTAPPDGTIHGMVPFHVSYRSGKGWFAQEWAC